MRVATRSLPLKAAIGDFIVFLLFPVIGSSSHSMGLNPDTFVRTVIPFALAWFIVGMLGKAFQPSVIRSPQRTVRLVPVVWLAAGVVGVVLRAVLFGRFDLTFSLIAIGVTGVMLVAWRLAFAVLRR